MRLEAPDEKRIVLSIRDQGVGIPRDAHVIIYCATGRRSIFAADRLQEMGYENVASMVTGFRGWCEAGGDVE